MLVLKTKNFMNRFAVDLMKLVIYLTEDIIYKAGTDSDYMYFIVSGTVVLITFSGREVRDWKHKKK